MKERKWSQWYVIFGDVTVVNTVYNICAESFADKLFLYSTQLDIDQALQVMKYEDIAWTIYRFRYINFSVHLLPINPFFNKKKSLVNNG